MLKQSLDKKRPVWWWIATWFGSGLSPVVSGTAGSLAALPFAYMIQVMFGNMALMAASVAIFAVGVWASNQYLKNNPGNSDPGQIVVDEVAGQWLLLSALYPTWQSYLVGFVLFRIFDIVKPWPVSYADQEIEGGLGVMADDMLAGLYPILAYLLFMIAMQYSGHGEIAGALTAFLGGAYVH